MKDKGFILLGILFMMVLMAVTAVALNRRAGMQARMAANQIQSVQTSLGQLAAMEQAIWQLTEDPCLRTTTSGENYTYNGTTYNRKVLNSTLSGYTDAITVSVTAPGAEKPFTTSFRYYIDTPFLVRKPNQVCCDSSDNIYFADSDNHSIWKIDATTGAITRVAGDGTSGFSGDGGLATEAKLDSPHGIALDTLGNIYIADTNNNRIRKVGAGIINTIAGKGGPAGHSGDGGPATSAKLKNPRGVFVDASGNIYIADTDNHRIRKVQAGIINTIAGKPGSGYSGDGGPATDAKLNSPRGVFVDASGNIYIADTENHCIRRVDAASQFINTVAGIGGSSGFEGDGGPATSAKLKNPRGVFLDASGNIYIADRDNNRIRKVGAGIINTIAGNGTAGYSGDGGLATIAEIDHPRGVCLNSTGEVIIADTINCCLRQVDLADVISTHGSTPATADEPGLNRPAQIAMYYDVSEQKHYLFIADKNNNRIRKLDTSTNWITTVAGTGTGGFSGDGGTATSAELNGLEGVFVDSSGNIYIADTDNHCIRKVDTASQIINTVAGIGASGGFEGDGGLATEAKLKNPQGVFVDSSGNIYIADTENHCIRKVDTASQIINTVAGIGENSGFSGDGGPATSAKLKKPQGVYVDASGNIYIADTDNNRIRKVEAGIIDTIAGRTGSGYNGDGIPATDARLSKPRGVWVDTNGNCFIADTINDRLRVVSAHDGKINTIAGTGSYGFNGDNQPATDAKMRAPEAAAMAATRGGAKIYISDTDNNRIRMLTFKIERVLY